MRSCKSWRRLATVLAACAGCGVFLPGLAEGKPRDLPAFAALDAHVNLWTRVYAGLSQCEGLVHDTYDPRIVYAVIDLRDLCPHAADTPARAEEKLMLGKARIRAVQLRVRGALQWLAAQGPKRAVGFTAAVASQLGPLTPRKGYLEAAGRVRFQRGLKERFAAGIRAAGGYQAAIERLFRDLGVPEELFAIAFTESLFDPHAYSYAGAAGVFQFMPATAKAYMHTGAEIDERKDPVYSAEAAAKLLKFYHRVLGNWPLAVTGYNTGVGRMMQAVKHAQSDALDTVIERSRNVVKGFGFASVNYYAEVLAARKVLDERSRYFPGAVPDPPLDFKTIVTPSPISLTALAAATSLDAGDLARLNPAFSPAILRGVLPLPAGHRLHVPTGSAKLAIAAMNSGAASPVRVAEKITRHTVKAGETLHQIARRHKVGLEAILTANGMDDPSRVLSGQTLLIPHYPAVP